MATRKKLTPGAYVGAPPNSSFEAARTTSRPLEALLWEIAEVAQGKLTIITPYFDARGLARLCDQWLTQRPDLQIDIVHRKEAKDAREEHAIRGVMVEARRRSGGRLTFLTWPAREASSGRLVSRESFHCKLVDPGNGQLVEMSSNLTWHAQFQNVETAFVHSPGSAQAFLLLVQRIRKLARPDPWQESLPKGYAPDAS